MKKVLIPTKLDPLAAEMLNAHGAYNAVQDENSTLEELAAEHSDAYAMIVRSEKVTEASHKIEEPDRQALRDVGFTDRDIWDIASVAGFYNMSNRVASATDQRPNNEYHGLNR